MSERKKDDMEIRSEEVQEILGTPPRWLVRWGATLALVTVVLLGWVGYWVRYPDVVSEKITITSVDPPKRLIANNPEAYISHILVENEDTVEVGQTLMVFKNKAKFEDVLTLENRLLQVKVMTDSALLALDPGRDLLLGELQEDVYDFMRKQEELRLTLSPKYEKLSISQLQKELRSVRTSIEYDRRQKEKLAGQLDLAHQRLRQEQNLFDDGALPYATLRKTREDILALEREMQGIESSIKAKQFEIESVRNKISGVRAGSRESRITASTELKDSFHRLKNQVDDWKKQYLITSPINGIVLIPNDNVSEQQFVPKNTELLVVVPSKKTETIGKIDLNINGSGKVREGQKVIVKLESYPFQEFGALVGVIDWKGRLPTNNTIPVEVHFPDGLITTTGKHIDPTREMTGTADIITEDKRFIERIFENFRTVPY